MEVGVGEGLFSFRGVASFLHSKDRRGKAVKDETPGTRNGDVEESHVEKDEEASSW